MKIKRVSCDQFAGIRDQSVSFDDGMNIIYGKNESGKSTLVNLIGRILFQDAKLNGTKHREFKNLYFPSGKKGSSVLLDSIDGKITLETEKGTYTLSKEWGVDDSCSLITPEGKIKNPDTINALLAEILQYGEGVYSELLFSSQRNTVLSLQNILDATTATEGKKELTEVLSQAFAESDGVSVDAVEGAIADKINELAGQHWDADRDLPTPKKGGGEWAVAEKDPSKDILLKSYYALQRAKKVLEQISELENAADAAAKAYSGVEAEVEAAKTARDEFSTFASRLEIQNARQQNIQHTRSDLQKQQDALKKWPEMTASLETARRLQKEKTDRAVLDLWEAVQKVLKEITEEDRTTAALSRPTAGEISGVSKALRQITGLENQLCGMNLTAAVEMLGGNELEITSLRTGEKVDVTNGLASISEAVKLCIPGVMQLQLTPADVNVTQIEQEIAEKRKEIAAIFAKYQVDSLENLENYARRIDEANGKIESTGLRLNRLLNGLTMEQLELLYRQADPTARELGVLQQQIIALCGREEISDFIAQTEFSIKRFTEDYKSISALSANVDALTAQLETLQRDMLGSEDIPAHFRGITDTQKYLKDLNAVLETKQQRQKDALTKKTETAKDLEKFLEAHPDAGTEAVEKARQEFEEKNALLKHWLHIQQVFFAEKEALASSPMEDIAKSFLAYLAQLSGGKLSTEFPDMEKLNMRIYSNDIQLDFAKLSEGTKDTVSLAFRLAVLDHLFPDGGGVIVFDDPFTDMDADRTRQACALLQSCAQRHQVIFLTCKEELRHMLSGKQIDF